MMRSVVAILLLAIALVGCASPASRVTPTPAPSITCVRETGPLPSALAGDPCPTALAAVRTLVAPLGFPIARIYLAPEPFVCGDLWPGVGSPMVCFGPAILPGRDMHGWVAFTGTAKIAAVALDRPFPPDGSSSTASPPPWQATLAAFVVSPAGWVMP